MSYLTRAELLESARSNIFTNDNGEVTGDKVLEQLENIINNTFLLDESNVFPISGANGGTGVVNTGKTITLGGNLSTVGAYNLALTVTAASTPTFPVGAGTLPYIAENNTWPGEQLFEGGVIIRNVDFSIRDVNLVLGNTGGTKIATDPTQKLSFWGSVPVIQPDNTITAVTPFVANTSGISNDTATWGGYKIGQIVSALKLVGLLR